MKTNETDDDDANDDKLYKLTYKWMTELVRVLFVDLARRLGEAIGDIWIEVSRAGGGLSTWEPYGCLKISLVKRKCLLSRVDSKKDLKIAHGTRILDSFRGCVAIH